MEEAVRIFGQKRLKGVINIDGSKNAAVALIPAALLSRGRVVLENVPRINDVDHLIELLHFLNVQVEIEGHKLIIDATNIKNAPLLKEQVSAIRASYYFMGTLIALFDTVEIAQPGGCKIGSRPIDIHEYALKELGINVVSDGGIYKLQRDFYAGKKILLPKISVGATINIMLAAVGANGTTIIENAAMEPEVIEVGILINQMGGMVKGLGTNRLVIEGGTLLKGTTHKIIPDRIEAGTYILFALALADDLEITNIEPNHLKSLLNVMNRLGAKYQLGETSIRIISSNILANLTVTTSPYPGFPTDLQQPLTTLLTKVEGRSYVKETIYPDRTTHINELAKMGADIMARGNLIIIKGGDSLKGAEVSAKDLRGGASLLLAGMMAEGETLLRGIKFIKRGYDNFIHKLNSVGADINLIEVEDEDSK